MTLPEYLLNTIDQELNKYPLKEIKNAYEELSNFYRKNRENIHLSLDTEQKRLAYISARLPATFSAILTVLQEIPDMQQFTTLLDIGAGCGTASIAACTLWDTIQKITLLEQNPEMIKIGKRLTHSQPILKNAEWFSSNVVTDGIQFPSSDIVLLSYFLNEVNPAYREDLILKLWNATNKYLIIVEPGTKEGFNLIHSLRDLFISKNCSLLSPCPHVNVCPAYGAHNLCHFSARVQRTSSHKYLKEGARGFEDEKFSYLILTKIQKENYHGRIVEEPLYRSGFISLKICTNQGFLKKIYTKKDKDNYTSLKKSKWGDKIEAIF